MWVCLCHGIRCRDVKDAASNGASRAGDVFRKFEVKVRCGKCVPTICNLLADAPPASVRPATHQHVCCAEG